MRGIGAPLPLTLIRNCVQLVQLGRPDPYLAEIVSRAHSKSVMDVLRGPQAHDTVRFRLGQILDHLPGSPAADGEVGRIVKQGGRQAVDKQEPDYKKLTCFYDRMLRVWIRTSPVGSECHCPEGGKGLSPSAVGGRGGQHDNSYQLVLIRRGYLHRTGSLFRFSATLLFAVFRQLRL